MSQYLPPSPRVQPLNLSTWWLTAFLLVINVGLFTWQVIHGMSPERPSTADALAWGADFAPLTYSGEAWRLGSSMFFHFGLIHLMLNMWALYMFGKLAEAHFGRRFYFGLYLLAGLLGGLFSGAIDVYASLDMLHNNVLQHEHLPKVSAGASGAVLGLGAALTCSAILPTRPEQPYIFHARSLMLIMGINLMVGFVVPGINNAAHIGGMCMGAVLAVVWYGIQRYSQHKVLYSYLLLVTATTVCLALYYFIWQYSQQVSPLWQLILNQFQQPINTP